MDNKFQTLLYINFKLLNAEVPKLNFLNVNSKNKKKINKNQTKIQHILKKMFKTIEIK